MAEETHDAQGAHITPVRVYLLNYGALLVLLALTYGAYVINLGVLSNLVALAIAVVKALLVLLFFMGLRYTSRLVWLWAGAGFMMLVILFTTVTDFITRDWIRIGGW